MNESYCLKVLDAKLRIRKMLSEYQDKIYLSFSGGKDSTVLAHLIKSVIKEENFCNIPFVFSNTGLELPETIDFVNNFSYEDVHTIYPDMRPIEVFEKYGRPAISKEWDDRISTYQNKLRQGFTKEEAVNPLVSRRASMLVGNHPKWPRKRIAKKNMWVLDTNIRISNKCCDLLKKRPFKVYEKENSMKAVFLGVRTQESMLRKTKYSSCYKESGGIKIVTPIYDWSDEDVDNYITHYNIHLSDAYTKLGYSRTGCYICPYNKRIFEDLDVLKTFHPKIFKYSYALMGDVYYEKELCINGGQSTFSL